MKPDWREYPQLNEKHRKMYRRIVRCAEAGYAASLDDLMSHCGIAKESTGEAYVTALVAAGLVLIQEMPANAADDAAGL